jgi:HPt (histidine-containing phosphotransfer) domain-containing protein
LAGLTEGELKTETAIDLNAVEKAILINFAGDREIFFDTVVGFLGTLPELFREFEIAYSQQNCGELRALAHRLKGETGLFHLPEVSERLAGIEKMSTQGCAPSSEVFAQAQSSLEQLENELELLLREKK